MSHPASLEGPEANLEHWHEHRADIVRDTSAWSCLGKEDMKKVRFSCSQALHFPFEGLF